MRSRTFGAVLAVALVAVAAFALWQHHRQDAPGGGRRARPLGAFEALGPLWGLPTPLRRAFTPRGDFAPMPAPAPGEWLAEHAEPGQSFAAYRAGGYLRPRPGRRTLALQPVGDFPPEGSPSLARLRGYAAAFFMLPVSLAPPLSADALKLRRRINGYTGKEQRHVGDLLERLKDRLAHQPTILAVMAVTMVDLWPGKGWNFVFGQAYLRLRTGAFSFARYDPTFYGKPRGPGSALVLLRRSMKVLTHETAHMFGLHHCIHFRCVMNGSNHLEEDDRVPLHLCPICLRKLQHAIGFDPAARYRALAAQYDAVGLTEEARFVRRRHRYITGREP